MRAHTNIHRHSPLDNYKIPALAQAREGFGRHGRTDMGKTGSLKQHVPASEGLPLFCEGKVCWGGARGARRGHVPGRRGTSFLAVHI